jgi:hypothetical protein
MVGIGGWGDKWKHECTIDLCKNILYNKVSHAGKKDASVEKKKNIFISSTEDANKKRTQQRGRTTVTFELQNWW